MAEEEKTQEESKDQDTEKKGKKSVTLFFILIAIALVIGGGIYSLYKSRSTTTPPTTQEESKAEELAPPLEETEPEEATETAESTTSAELENGEEELIKQAVLKRVQLNEEEVAFTITENTGTHAKGNIREIDAVGGGYWLAAKDEDGNWVAVYDGQANPLCESVDDYEFPNDMVPECLDESDNLVIR